MCTHPPTPPECEEIALLCLILHTHESPPLVWWRGGQQLLLTHEFLCSPGYGCEVTSARHSADSRSDPSREAHKVPLHWLSWHKRFSSFLQYIMEAILQHKGVRNSICCQQCSAVVPSDWGLEMWAEPDTNLLTSKGVAYLFPCFPKGNPSSYRKMRGGASRDGFIWRLFQHGFNVFEALRANLPLSLSLSIERPFLGF